MHFDFVFKGAEASGEGRGRICVLRRTFLLSRRRLFPRDDTRVAPATISGNAAPPAVRLSKPLWGGGPPRPTRSASSLRPCVCVVRVCVSPRFLLSHVYITEPHFVHRSAFYLCTENKRLCLPFFGVFRFLWRPRRLECPATRPSRGAATTEIATTGWQLWDLQPCIVVHDHA